MQAEVERVRHAAVERDPEIGLELAAVVPCERRHAIAALESEPGERGREQPRALRHLAVTAARERLVRAPAHDGLVGVDDFSAPDDGGKGERKIHHQPAHRSLLGERRLYRTDYRWRRRGGSRGAETRRDAEGA